MACFDSWPSARKRAKVREVAASAILEPLSKKTHMTVRIRIICSTIAIAAATTIGILVFRVSGERSRLQRINQSIGLLTHEIEQHPGSETASADALILATLRQATPETLKSPVIATANRSVRSCAATGRLDC